MFHGFAFAFGYICRYLRFWRHRVPRHFLANIPKTAKACLSYGPVNAVHKWVHSATSLSAGRNFHVRHVQSRDDRHRVFVGDYRLRELLRAVAFAVMNICVHSGAAVHGDRVHDRSGLLKVLAAAEPFSGDLFGYETYQIHARFLWSVVHAEHGARDRVQCGRQDRRGRRARLLRLSTTARSARTAQQARRCQQRRRTDLISSHLISSDRSLRLPLPASPMRCVHNEQSTISSNLLNTYVY